MSAFNIFFNLVENYADNRVKGAPWLCDRCHSETNVLLKMTIDYQTLVLCKKCLMEAKKHITEREKELRDGGNGCKQPA